VLIRVLLEQQKLSKQANANEQSSDEESPPLEEVQEIKHNNSNEPTGDENIRVNESVEDAQEVKCNHIKANPDQIRKLVSRGFALDCQVRCHSEGY
jgi:hypothetical protein